MYLRKKIAALAMAGAAATLVLAAAPALALAAAPALASSQSADHVSTITPEIAYGAIYGKPATAEFATIPLTWRGLVDTHGTFAGHGAPPRKGQEHTFPTAAGNLVALVTATPQQGQTSNASTCHFTFTTTVAFVAVPGKSTGKFAGATGPGAVKVSFAGYVPRYMSGPKKGQCNTSPSAPELTKGAVASFVLSAVLTTT
jgi:hypothetical protein